MFKKLKIGKIFKDLEDLETFGFVDYSEFIYVENSKKLYVYNLQSESSLNFRVLFCECFGDIHKPRGRNFGHF